MPTLYNCHNGFHLMGCILFSGHYLCSYPLLRMVSLMIVGGFDKAPWNYWGISYLRYFHVSLFQFPFLGVLNSEIACNSVCYLSRLLVLLEKLYWRVAVMMKVQVLRRRGGLSLRFLEGISVMKFSLHYIWFELMSASQCVR